MKCFFCQKENPIDGKPGLRETCFSCDADLHVCLNCKFYDKTAYNECHETSADRVVEKDRANFCEYFQVGDGQIVISSSSDNIKTALEKLFKK